MHIPLNESQVSENWKERSKKTNCKTNGCLRKLTLVFPVEFNYILLMDSNCCTGNSDMCKQNNPSKQIHTFVSKI